MARRIIPSVGASLPGVSMLVSEMWVRYRSPDRVVRIIRSWFVGEDLVFCKFWCIPVARSIRGVFEFRECR